MTAASLTRLPKYTAGGLGILAALTLAIEQAWPLISREIPPTFVYQPCTDPASDEAFVGFHGMQGDITQFDPLMPYFQTRGHALIAICGSNVVSTPAAAIHALREYQLSGHGLTLVGVSLGTNKLVRCLRLCLRYGIRIEGVILISGPPTPKHVLWSRPLKHGTRLLRGGPLAATVWQIMNRRAMSSALTAEAIADVIRCSRIPAANIVSGAAALRRGPKLRPNEFAGIETLVIERLSDPLVGPCFEDWRRAFPRAIRAFIPVAGHATLGDCPDLYTSAIDKWREGIRHQPAQSI